mgnify:CR=1 FL=1
MRLAPRTTVCCVSKPEDPQEENGLGKDIRAGVVSIGGDTSSESGRISGFDARRIPADRLLEAIEGELIPRLMMAHAAGATINSMAPSDVAAATLKIVPLAPATPVALPTRWPTDDIVRFAEWASRSDATDMIEFVDNAIDRGATLTNVYLDLVAPTARLLGDNWLSDRASFIDVHMGLLELHRLVSHYELTDFDMTQSSGHNILLSAAPGDQHTFGILLVADFFRRAGWEVDNDSGHTEDQIARKVASTPFSCVGLSLYNEEQLVSMTSCIERLRNASLNEDILIVVGGEFFTGRSSPSAIVGADLCILDAGTAVDQVAAHLEGRPVPTSRRSGRGVTSD